MFSARRPNDKNYTYWEKIKSFKPIQLVFVCYWLVACSEATSPIGPTPTTSPTPTPTSAPSPTPTPAPTFSVSGTILVTNNIAADSDNNDPLSAFADNSTFSTAQRINNLTTLNGFVTKTATGDSSDRYFSTTDEDDVFRVNLLENQLVRLEVSDFLSDNASSKNIDLMLFDSGFNLVGQSTSNTKLEEIRAAVAGEFYIQVKAVSGASKYTLQILSPSTTSSVHADRDVSLEEMIANEAIVGYKVASTFSQSYSALNTISTDKRPRLEKMGNQMSTKMALMLRPNLNNTLTKLELELREQNLEAFEKYQTLKQINTLQTSDSVEYASPNFMWQLQRIPDDTFYNLQWHYPSINLPQAWDITTGTPAAGDVVVAVIDSGVFLAHEDLDAQLLPGYDFISDNDNARDGENGIDNNPDDPGDDARLGQSSWHGTHVAATVAAESNNGQGVAGVSWGAKIMPLRACGNRGCSSYDVIQSLRFAAGLSNDSNTVPTKTADIINLSLGGFGSSQAEADVYQDLYNRGVIIVAAAGNEQSTDLAYPASYPGVFSVSALNAVNTLAFYSNSGSAIDIAAPGGDINVDQTGDGRPDGVASAVVNDSSGSRQSDYAFYQGTSMASPHVAGVFALMKAVYPALTPQQIDASLMAGSLTTDLGVAGRDDQFGYGKIDAFKAVVEANRLANGGALQPVVSVTPGQVNLTSTNSAEVTLSSIGGGSPTVSSVAASETWLSISAQTVDAQGMGSYLLSVNRTGLADGQYTAKVTFNFDTAASVELNVSMIVGTPVVEGQTARITAFLFDVETGRGRYAATINNTGSGLTYTFTGVEQDEYYMAVGSDVDSDNSYCTSGEACGIYPTNSEPVKLLVDGNKTNIDASVVILNGLSDVSRVRQLELKVEATEQINAVLSR